VIFFVLKNIFFKGRNVINFFCRSIFFENSIFLKYILEDLN